MGIVSTRYLRAAGELVVEAIWPTRCIVCDCPGQVLCSSCRRALRYIDQWDACPRCGAPYGRVQCTECNTYSLREMGYRHLPFARCVSAVHFDDAAAQVVRGRKDLGERRLADSMAFAIACAVPPDWMSRVRCVCPVPASPQALRRRGFDHGLELAREVGGYLSLPCLQALQAGAMRDQRGLSRQMRAQNMRQVFGVVYESIPWGVLLVDDVCTTGATVLAASEALLEGGAHDVLCATFARVC